MPHSLCQISHLTYQIALFPILYAKSHISHTKSPCALSPESLFHSQSQIYSRLKTWSFGPGQSSKALLIKVASSFGVLECWSVGRSENPEFQLGLVLSALHYSTTPSLQKTAAKTERSLKLPWGDPKARSFVLGFLTYLKGYFLSIFITLITQSI